MSRQPQASVNPMALTPDRRVVTISPVGGFPEPLRSHLGFCMYKSALKLRGMLDESFRELGVISPQFGLLTMLLSRGPASQIEIGQCMAIDKATMVKLIDGLETLGYVKRTPDKIDRRAKIVEITVLGSSAQAKMVTKAKTVELKFTERLSAEERETLRKLTARLLE